MKKDDVLVTVGVMTYNSSKFVIETLDSINNQDYKRMELVVSDDGSKDDTIKIVNDWIEKHASRFESVQVLTVEKNTGTAGNCNRILRAARGEWVKYIAGDDVLLNNGIKKLIEFIKENNEVSWLFGKSVFYNGEISPDHINEEGFTRYNERLLDLLNGTAKEQFKRLLKFNNFVGPGHIIRRKTLISVGGFDEDLFILEDYPMWLRLTGADIKCHFLDEYIAGYRLSDQSVCANRMRLFNLTLSELLYKMKRKYCYKYYRRRDKIATIVKFYIDIVFHKLGCNKLKYQKVYSVLHAAANQLYK